MTPEERAKKVMHETKLAGARWPDEGNMMRDAITQAIAEAVAAERERCAKMVEDYQTDQPGVGVTYHGKALAACIRKGGAK